jgi:hypothetical protein
MTCVGCTSGGREQRRCANRWRAAAVCIEILVDAACSATHLHHGARCVVCREALVAPPASTHSASTADSQCAPVATARMPMADSERAQRQRAHHCRSTSEAARHCHHPAQGIPARTPMHRQQVHDLAARTTCAANAAEQEQQQRRRRASARARQPRGPPSRRTGGIVQSPRCRVGQRNLYVCQTQRCCVLADVTTPMKRGLYCVRLCHTCDCK